MQRVESAQAPWVAMQNFRSHMYNHADDQGVETALALWVVMRNSDSLIHDAFGLTKSDSQRYNALSRFRQHTNKHQSCSFIHEYFHTFLILFMYKCIILFHI